MFPIDRLVRIVPDGLSLASKDAHAIVAIAFLSVAADRTVHPDEESALRAIARRLAPAVTDGDGVWKKPDALVDGLFERIGTSLARDDADARLRATAADVATPAGRELAYKVAYALAMVDLAASDEEFEFDLQLIDALGLAQDDADRWTAEVVEALDDDESP